MSKKEFLKNKEIKKRIKALESFIKNPKEGLPEEIFYFISRNTPLVNVDLLIKDEKGRTLLAWRDDKYCGKGWHIPGGIIRYKEKLETRIQKVAKKEIGIPIKFNPRPIAINQIICTYKNRGHFISILYKCFLPSTFIPKNKGLTSKDAGYLKWHKNCPKDFLKKQRFYKKYIEKI